ncbi:MAG TPA: hypothetical protein VFT57_20315, partial [Gemmatimonadaceae bacterium]|nr:hypothetical protein [Gemmatimonadaceae bacterium]
APGAPNGTRPHNSDSRLDSAVLKNEHHVGTSATAAGVTPADVTYRRFAPELPPRPAGKYKVEFFLDGASVGSKDFTIGK